MNNSHKKINKILKFGAIFLILPISLILGMILFFQNNPGAPCPDKEVSIVFAKFDEIAKKNVFENPEVEAKVACSDEQRTQGLMNTKPLNVNEGMLFVFPYEGNHGFWMKNTPINLSIAFISREGLINEIREMKGQDETPIIPNDKVKYTLEMREKWFEENHILAGHQIKFKQP